MQHDLSFDERVEWLRLARTENVGPITFRRLVEQFGTPGKALEKLPDLARRGGRSRALRIPSARSIRQELSAADRQTVRFVAVPEPNYPRLLRALEDRPPLVALKGATHLLDRPAIAIVGARNASANGRRFAESLARDLSGLGFVITSGLARGIDGAAHRGALSGGTIAVMAGGIDVCYPPEHQDLYDQIAVAGLLLAESPLGQQPHASHFPRRNRLVSGLSLGVVVVEASQRSGSLITARLALEQGREVMAVPGSPLDPRCAGPNHLIRQGATLITSADDIRDALGPVDTLLEEPDPGHFGPVTPTMPPERELDLAHRWLAEALSPTPTPVDELIRQCQLSPAAVLTALLELELAGRVERVPGNKVSLL